MTPRTLRSSTDCLITAQRDGHKIGILEYVTFVTEGNAAMGTVSFSECIADPRGCDIVVESEIEAGMLKRTFTAVDLSNNLYLETPIAFVTDTYIEEAI